MAARVWIVGEGNSELGRPDGYGSRGRRVLDALLVRVCANGWQCVAKLQWNRIKKFRAGGAHVGKHGDYLNVLGLVLQAHENKADAVAFSRDTDSDPERGAAVHEAIDWLRDESGWQIDVIGGVAKPAIEGWILALCGVRDTDMMSRNRTIKHLNDQKIEAKSTDDYVDIVDQCTLGDPETFDLPPGTESLRSWLATAHQVLNRLAPYSVG